MRNKEELNDYRYFPEPDLQPVIVKDEYVQSVRAKMPALPKELADKYVNEYKLPEYDASVLTDQKDVALYFEELTQHTTQYKAASNWVMGPIKSYINELTLPMKDFPIPPQKIAELLQMIGDGKISNSAATQKIFPELIKTPQKTVLQVAEELNLLQDSNTDSIQPIIEDVINSFPDKVEQYKSGKKGLLGMFMGEVMKRSKGKADPKVANKLLQESLDS
jgi:aspartyl-tRNA(Asn)/glutamyl-tRNA(Gln) amidotransferase subunit B